MSSESKEFVDSNSQRKVKVEAKAKANETPARELSVGRTPRLPSRKGGVQVQIDGDDVAQAFQSQNKRLLLGLLHGSGAVLLIFGSNQRGRFHCKLGARGACHGER